MALSIPINLSDIQLTFQSISIADSIPLLRSLLLYILGITVYSVFIFKFYRFIAKKDLFHLDLQQYNTAESKGTKKFFAVLLYILEYLIIFPLFAAAWFAVLFILLVFLSKNQSVESILLTSMAIIAIVRITSYYDEDLSKDLAKMLPFTLLGIFLVDSSYISLSTATTVLTKFPSFIKIFVYYFIFVVFIEFISRILYSIYRAIFSPKSGSADNQGYEESS